MIDIRQAQFSGRLGRDPETRETRSGSVCNFSIACNQYKKEDGPIWVRVSVWGKKGEPCQRYLTKGSPVMVAGELSVREWEGKTQIELSASQVVFLPSGDKAKQAGSPDPDEGRWTPPSGKTSDPFSPEDEEIPF